LLDVTLILHVILILVVIVLVQTTTLPIVEVGMKINKNINKDQHFQMYIALLVEALGLLIVFHLILLKVLMERIVLILGHNPILIQLKMGLFKITIFLILQLTI
jgi:hypothetical protein